MAWAAVRSLTANRSCMSGSPPLKVNPPAMTFSPVRYLRSSSIAFPSDTGMPLLIFQVSGLWQYRHRNWQPVVHATTRTPGPSTVEPVVNECRKPMSPVANALRTSDSGTPRPRCTRSSKGLFACSSASFSCAVSLIRHLVPVKRAVDHVHLLLTSQPHEVHGIS